MMNNVSELHNQAMKLSQRAMVARHNLLLSEFIEIDIKFNKKIYHQQGGFLDRYSEILTILRSL
jgi:hypothetical protein